MKTGKTIIQKTIKINGAEPEVCDLLEDDFRVNFNMKYSAIFSKTREATENLKIEKSIENSKKPKIKERAKGTYKGSSFEFVHYLNNVFIMRIKDKNVENFLGISRYLSREVINDKPICSLTIVDVNEEPYGLGYESLIIWDKFNPEKTLKSVANNNCFWLKSNEKIVEVNTHNGRKLSPYKADANQTMLIADEKCM